MDRNHAISKQIDNINALEKLHSLNEKGDSI